MNERVLEYVCLVLSQLLDLLNLSRDLGSKGFFQCLSTPNKQIYIHQHSAAVIPETLLLNSISSLSRRRSVNLSGRKTRKGER